MIKDFKTYEKIKWYYKGKFETDEEKPVQKDNYPFNYDFKRVFWKIKVVDDISYYENLYRRLTDNDEAYEALIGYYTPRFLRDEQLYGYDSFYLNLDEPITDKFRHGALGYMPYESYYKESSYDWYIKAGYKYLGDLEDWLDVNKY